MKPAPPPALPGPLFELRPDALDANGAAVGLLEPPPESPGEAAPAPLLVHVSGALPGETITAELVHLSPHRRGTGARDAWATLHEVLVPSPERVAPVCPAYGVCGGCHLQHLSDAGQRAWKRALVEDALAAVPGALPAVTACVPSPHALGYRNQAKYVVSRDAAGQLVLGAYAPRSHRIVDLDGCRLGEPPQDQVAGQLRLLLEQAGVEPFDERRRSGLVRYVVLRTNARGEVLVALVTARRQFPQGAAIARDLHAAIPAVIGVVQNLNDSPGNVIFGRDEWPLWGASVLGETFGAVEVEVGAQAFLQLNRGVAQLAYAAIRDALLAAFPPAGPSPTGGDPRDKAGKITRLLDVYSGVGSIAFSLADLADEIVAIEENPAATRAGAQAAARAGLGQVRFITDEAAAGIDQAGPAEAVVLNPPRAGAGAGICAAIVKMRPQLVAYLSCNPATLARDLAILTAAGSGLVIESLQPFDMLPHTAHVETLAIVRKSPAVAGPTR